MKSFFLYILIFIPFYSFAQTAKEDIARDPSCSGSNYANYRAPENPKYTQAPIGYRPFYISTYARHGSRHFTSSSSYETPLQLLQKGYMESKITSLGKEVMVIVDSLRKLSINRLGDLSSVGFAQHYGIAQRMYTNFPEVFTNGVHLEAYSTPLSRTMMSMLSEVSALKGCCPEMTIYTDASLNNMCFLDAQHPDAFDFRSTPEAVEAVNAYRKNIISSDRFIKSIFSDKKFIKANVNAKSFMDQIFNLANLCEGVGVNLNLFKLFTTDELYDMWKKNNFKWYNDFGLSPLSKQKAPYTQVTLLKNFINTADTCLISSRNNITLRFGHDVDLLPLAALMRLHEASYVGSDPEEVAEHWRNYRITPMACNIQMVFYKKTKTDPILVKILLNEREQTLPISSEIAPYYNWTDVRKFYQDIINEKL